MAVWMLFFWGSWRFHVILIIHILLAAKACLALAPACSTWSTDPPRSCLDTSINGTNSSCDTSGSNRANSHNASSINASFSGAWSKDAICGFQELGNDWGFVGDTNSSSDGEGMINKSAMKIWEDDGRWSGITMGNVYHPTSSFSWRFSWALGGAWTMITWVCSRSRRQPRAQGFRTILKHSVALWENEHEQSSTMGHFCDFAYNAILNVVFVHFCQRVLEYHLPSPGIRWHHPSLQYGIMPRASFKGSTAHIYGTLPL